MFLGYSHPMDDLFSPDGEKPTDVFSRVSLAEAILPLITNRFRCF